MKASVSPCVSGHEEHRYHKHQNTGETLTGVIDIAIIVMLLGEYVRWMSIPYVGLEEALDEARERFC